MKKILLTLVTVVLLATTMIYPQLGLAGASDTIKLELEKIKKQEQDASLARANADKKANDLKAQKDKEVVSMSSLIETIRVQGARLSDLNTQLNMVTKTLQDTSVALEEAEDRVAARDKLLKSRLRLMYMNGSVSYLDVILSSTSFSDFLDRYDVLQTIVGRDKDILEANKADRIIVADKKKQVEIQLAQAKVLYAEAETVTLQLQEQEKQKAVLIASLSTQVEAAEDLSEEQEKNLILLARQRSEVTSKYNEALRQEQEAKRQEELRKQALAKAAQATQVQSTQAQSTQTANKYSNGKLAWPLPSSTTITSTFGYRIDPIRKVSKLHKGIDISAPNGTTIVAADYGVVLIAAWVSGYGNTVVIDHGKGIWTWYGHIRENGIKVKEGAAVDRGQKIAEVGSTGDSTGNHLHFEVRVNEQAVNPMPYLQ